MGGYRGGSEAGLEKLEQVQHLSRSMSVEEIRQRTNFLLSAVHRLKQARRIRHRLPENVPARDMMTTSRASIGQLNDPAMTVSISTKQATSVDATNKSKTVSLAFICFRLFPLALDQAAAL